MSIQIRHLGCLAIVIGVGFLLGACATRDRGASSGSSGAAAVEGNGGSAADEDSGRTAASESDAATRATANVVYFDFDRTEIRPEFRESLVSHASRLGVNSRLSIRLEGHADERGTREYNIGLGERRAQAVRSFLLLNGARDAQIKTISYGEERPAVMEQGEAAWSMNRRVEIAYVNP